VSRKLLLSWSSGKDSAWALHCLRQGGDYEVAGLLTTLNAAFDRVAMHSTRRALLEAQARAAGLPLHAVPLPWPCSNAQYEAAMRAACDAALAEGIEAIAFGDLFLEDVRRYREERLEGTGLKPVFPVWGKDTRLLAEEMIAGGLRARIVCVDPKKLPRSLPGGNSMWIFCAISPREWIPAAKTGSFTARFMRDRCFASRFRSRAGKWSSGMDLCLPTCGWRSWRRRKRTPSPRTTIAAWSFTHSRFAGNPALRRSSGSA
jgi:diphthamide synthase (EF-2-diphthine--ammonia ligase)